MKTFLIWLLPSLLFANPVIDEALLISAQTYGSNLYVHCIVTPPTTSEQYAICTSLKFGYKSSILALYGNYPPIVSLTPSPYAWSVYDVCSDEMSKLIFPVPSVSPYCPN
ncbi:MAG: hypothetical protein K2P99_01675 [Burkholderiales bacterium]|nr:hypothetical protein [Burkholderiales bacterium]